MPTPEDISDRKLSLGLFLSILAVTAIAVGTIVFFAGPTIAAAVAPGIGLRTAAIIAFIITLVTLIVMAIASGDGLLGELQFMLIGFAGFFVVCWLMIAWIF